MLLSAVSVANIDCLGWADQPRLAGAELRSCQAQPRPRDSLAVVSSPGLAASSSLGGIIVLYDVVHNWQIKKYWNGKLKT